MPTNLPPEYFDAEKRFRQAQTPVEKVARLEELISTVPKHKGTDKLRADLRRQLSRLREEAQSRKKHGAHQSAYHISREGAGQVVILGSANVGKSALLAALTNAEPEVSPQPFDTWKPLPGMMPIENIQVQLIDTPALDRDFIEPGLFDLARRADLLWLVVDLQADPVGQVEHALELLESHRIFPQDSEDSSGDQRFSAFLPITILANKCDDEIQDELFDLFCELYEGECPLFPVSAVTGRNFDRLKRRVFDQLHIVRVYPRPPGQEPDMERPFVLKKGGTVLDLAEMIHRDFYDKFKSARVWGSSSFDGQLVQREYPLEDGDIVEIRI
jgi:uncharacterized protein